STAPCGGRAYGMHQKLTVVLDIVQPPLENVRKPQEGHRETLPSRDGRPEVTDGHEDAPELDRGRRRGRRSAARCLHATPPGGAAAPFGVQRHRAACGRRVSWHERVVL